MAVKELGQKVDQVEPVKSSVSFLVLGFERVFLLAQFGERGKRGFTFGGFFTFTLAASEFDPAMMHRALEDPIMVGTGRGNDVILGRLRGNRLKEFLQFALGVFQSWYYRECAHGTLKFPENEFTGGLEPAIKENCAEEGLERIGQGGRTLASAVEFLASADDQMLAEAKPSRVFGEGASIDQFCAGFGERTFTERREISIQFASEHKLKDRIAKEFQTLIGLERNTLLVRD